MKSRYLTAETFAAPIDFAKEGTASAESSIGAPSSFEKERLRSFWRGAEPPRITADFSAASRASWAARFAAVATAGSFDGAALCCPNANWGWQRKRSVRAVPGSQAVVGVLRRVTNRRRGARGGLEEHGALALEHLPRALHQPEGLGANVPRLELADLRDQRLDRGELPRVAGAARQRLARGAQPLHQRELLLELLAVRLDLGELGAVGARVVAVAQQAVLALHGRLAPRHDRLRLRGADHQRLSLARGRSWEAGGHASHQARPHPTEQRATSLVEPLISPCRSRSISRSTGIVMTFAAPAGPAGGSLPRPWHCPDGVRPRAWRQASRPAQRSAGTTTPPARQPKRCRSTRSAVPRSESDARRWHARPPLPCSRCCPPAGHAPQRAHHHAARVRRRAAVGALLRVHPGRWGREAAALLPPGGRQRRGGQATRAVVRPRPLCHRALPLKPRACRG